MFANTHPIKTMKNQSSIVFIAPTMKNQPKFNEDCVSFYKMFQSYEKYIKTRFCFISLPYHMKMLLRVERLSNFFFQKCYQIYIAILTSFPTKNGFFEEKLATFSWFSLVILHPFATKKRRIEFVSGSKTGSKPDLNGQKPY